MKAQVGLEIEALYREHRFDPRFNDEKEQQEEVALFISREHQFVVRIWDELTRFSTDNPYRINLLLDIDETLGRFMPDETGNDGRTILRPTTVRLLNRLSQEYGNRIHMGFITTRGGDRLEAQLNDPQDLQPIEHVIDRSILFSTRNIAAEIDFDNPEDVALYQAIRGGATLADTAAYCQNIISPEKFEEGANGSYWKLFHHTGDRLKTSLLAHLVRKYPNQAYMVVDDFPYPSILRKDDPHIRGVWLDEEASFYL